VTDEIQEGEEILVKVIEVDGDRIRLSRKAVLREKRGEAGAPESAPPPPRSDERSRAGGGRPHPHRRPR